MVASAEAIFSGGIFTESILPGVFRALLSAASLAPCVFLLLCIYLSLAILFDTMHHLTHPALFVHNVAYKDI